MSEVKVNKITPTADCGTVTLGDSGDNFTIPAGVTVTSAGGITNSGTITNTGTISGGTISGNLADQVNWDTTAKTESFTAVSTNGYFVNTTSASLTVTLPASPSAGDIVGIKDYANTAHTSKIVIARNGSKIQGIENDFDITTEGQSIILLYVDSTQGWLATGAAKASDITQQVKYVAATGGTVITSGNFKTHIFTSPGNFCVSCAGNPLGSTTLDYFVVAGGGGGHDFYYGGGGGGGGFRHSNSYGYPAPVAPPLASSTGLTASATCYPVTVGGGGALGAKGSDSTFSTITSTGGGTAPTGPGGSGGGGNSNGGAGGSGNTPPVSPPQGNPGGSGNPAPNPINGGSGGGGGGAGAPGGNGTNPGSGPGVTAGPGGSGSYVGVDFGIPTSYGTPGPVGSTRYFSGGGGGGTNAANQNRGSGGTGGGGRGAPSANAGGTNKGGGGGGGSHTSNGSAPGKAGGSGFVAIRYQFQGS